MNFILEQHGIIDSSYFLSIIIILFHFFPPPSAAAEGLVRSAGIVGVVSVFPIGLLLLLASFLYFKAEERKKPHPKKKLSESKLIFCA